MNANTNISTRALLVWLNVRTWSARKLDKVVTNKVNRDHAASSKASRTNKNLMPDSAASYQALVTFCSAMRAKHYSNTLPYTDGGYRLLPTANFIAYTDDVRKDQQAFDRLLDAFVLDYPQLRLDACASLGSMYNTADYPDASDIRKKFSVDLSYMPLPNVGDVRVDLAADQVSAIEADIQAKAQQSVDRAMRDVWERMHETIGKVVATLNDPKKIFRDSLIENVSEMTEMLKTLNISDDPNLEALRSEVEQTIASMQPETLRASKHARQTTADSAQAILDKMAAFYQSA